jgi:hypothetical protein
VFKSILNDCKSSKTLQGTTAALYRELRTEGFKNSTSENTAIPKLLLIVSIGRGSIGSPSLASFFFTSFFTSFFASFFSYFLAAPFFFISS